MKVREALAPVSALLLSVAILLTGNGLQTTLLPLRAQLESFSTVAIGALGSSYFLGFAAGCVLGAYVIRRVGHIRTFTAMAAIASAMPLAHVLALHPVAWAVSRGATGFCFAVLYIVIESWLNERSTNETRGTVLSAYLTINLTVLTLGQLMIALYSPSGFELFAIASVIVSLAAVPIALARTTVPGPVQSVAVRPLRIYATSPVGFAGCAAVGLSNGAWWSLAPIYADKAGFDPTGIALFMSAAVLGGAIAQWPIGRLSDSRDRRQVLLVTCVIGSVAGVALVLSPVNDTYALLGMSAVWGLLAFPLYSLAMAHANDHADPSEFVEVSSGLLLVYAGGAVIGPLAAASLMAVMGPGGLYVYTAVIHALLALFTIWRMTQRAPAPLEEHVSFMDTLQAGQTVSPVFDVETQIEIEEEAESVSQSALSLARLAEAEANGENGPPRPSSP